MHPTDLKRSALLYSCHTQKTREAERFVQEHTLIHILSGNMQIQTLNGSYILNPGNTVLLKRNQLIKAAKLPAETGEFKAVSVYLEQAVLKEYAKESNISTSFKYDKSDTDDNVKTDNITTDRTENEIYIDEPGDSKNVMFLQNSPLYESYARSLTAYHQGAYNNGLTGLKVKEALMLMLLVDPGAAKLLFDFHEPEKTDLKEFMETYFKFNVHIRHLAYLTGRSLATFKRDFTKTFHTSPSKWLQERRLKEACYLIKEKGMKPSEVYTELGFEDFSHFSFAFKNAYGKAPSRI